jgi:hypothetical protein
VELVNKRVGDRRIFAVEFEVQPDRVRPINEWWGSLWLWAEAKCIGNTEKTEMISIGMDQLVSVARQTGSRMNSFLSSLTPTQALDSIKWAVYGDGDSKLEKLVSSPESLHRFDVLPTSAGPFFDNWEATLIEEGGCERFIWRNDARAVCEAKWKLGTFQKTVLQAKAAFEQLEKLRVPEGGRLN